MPPSQLSQAIKRSSQAKPPSRALDLCNRKKQRRRENLSSKPRARTKSRKSLRSKKRNEVVEVEDLEAVPYFLSGYWTGRLSGPQNIGEKNTLRPTRPIKQKILRKKLCQNHATWVTFFFQSSFPNKIKHK